MLLTFFLLKDGERIWGYILSFTGDRSRAHADEIGTRVYAALAGYVRGIALVGLVDAILIGFALLIIGVPLVIPIMVITFFAAFVPLIGAFIAGLVAVLIALVSGGVLDAALVLGAIILVQQIEGHVLYPLLMGRTVHLHPAVIVVALAAGGILGGIVGVFLAVPTAGIISVVLEYARDRPAPESPLSESARRRRLNSVATDQSTSCSLSRRKQHSSVSVVEDRGHRQVVAGALLVLRSKPRGRWLVGWRRFRALDLDAVDVEVRAAGSSSPRDARSGRAPGSGWRTLVSVDSMKYVPVFSGVRNFQLAL